MGAKEHEPGNAAGEAITSSGYTKYSFADAAMRQAALERGRWWLKYQEDRRAAYHARAGWLLGFAGVIAALIGSQAQDIFEDAAALGGTARWITAALLVGSAVGVVLAGILSVVVLWPFETKEAEPAFLRDSLKMKSLAEMIDPEIELLTDIVDNDASHNASRLRVLNGAFVALLIGLVMFVAQVAYFVDRGVAHPCGGEVTRTQVSKPHDLAPAANEALDPATNALTAYEPGSTSLTDFTDPPPRGRSSNKLAAEITRLAAATHKVDTRLTQLESAAETITTEVKSAGRPCKK